MSTVYGLLKLFVWNSKLKLSKRMQYRFDFILGALISLAFAGIGPIFQYLIFTQTKGYPGWTLYQIILFQGVLLIWIGIRDALFADVRWTVEALVRQGGFDRLLLKPYPAIGILLADGISMGNMGALIVGTVISVISVIKLGIHIGPLQVLLFLYFFICGIVLSMAVNVLYCSINIMLIQMWRIGDFFNNLMRFAEYPADIYGDAARVIFVAVIPFAVWVYFPVQALLDRLDGFMVIGSLSCFVLFWLSLKFWGRCLKKYTSMGG